MCLNCNDLILNILLYDDILGKADLYKQERKVTQLANQIVNMNLTIAMDKTNRTKFQ